MDDVYELLKGSLEGGIEEWNCPLKNTEEYYVEFPQWVKKISEYYGLSPIKLLEELGIKEDIEY